jgi:hypothetical protein
VFDLKRPCLTCPFRRGQGSRFRLHPERLREIAEAVAFQCHKTVVYGDHAPAPGDRPQQCAGLMAVLHREGRPNQIAQLAQRLGALDPAALDPAGEAYASWPAALEAHDGNEPAD